MGIEVQLWIIALYFVLAGIGTAIANRDKTSEVRRARWIKFIVHLVIVYSLVGVMMYAIHYLTWVALVIFALGAWELVKVRQEGKAAGFVASPFFYIAGFLLYGFICTGFYKMTIAPDPGATLFLFLLVFTFDGFSQVIGQMAGRRKLFPATSPNKTVLGLVGGSLMVLVTMVISALWSPLVTKMSFSTAFLMLGLCLVVVIGAVAGDWLASYYKRRHGVKDFSALIPGHGGVLDRFDSWLAVGALLWWLGRVLDHF